SNPATPPGTPATGTAGENSPTCESKGADLSWIMCPVLYMARGVIETRDNTIQGLLQTPDQYVESDGTKEAWRRFRDIAYIILVPIVLVMVIGTALGFELVSAYTVKRALPRLIAAVLFIALSYEITKFLIDLTNTVGLGLGGL